METFPTVRRVFGLSALIVMMMAARVAFSGLGPVDGPVPPPGSKATPDTPIECLTIDVGSAHLYHPLERPIKSTHEAMRAAAIRFGQELELKGIGTGDRLSQQQGQAIAKGAILDRIIYTTGNLCLCVPIGACGCVAGCSGGGCGHLKTIQ